MQGLEWIILLAAIVLLLFGAKKIPELAKSVGRARGEFDKGRKEVQQEMKDMERSKTKTKPKSKDSKIVRAAKDLGIDTKGKSESELKKEIQAAVKTG